MLMSVVPWRVVGTMRRPFSSTSVRVKPMPRMFKIDWPAVDPMPWPTPGREEPRNCGIRSSASISAPGAESSMSPAVTIVTGTGVFIPLIGRIREPVTMISSGGDAPPPPRARLAVPRTVESDEPTNSRLRPSSTESAPRPIGATRTTSCHPSSILAVKPVSRRSIRAPSATLYLPTRRLVEKRLTSSNGNSTARSACRANSVRAKSARWAGTSKSVSAACTAAV